MLKIAACYYKGKGVVQDKNLSFNWFLKAAESEHPAGMLMVAMLYSSGVGVEENKDVACTWFTEFYEQTMRDSEFDLNDSTNMLDLGMFYFLKYFSDVDTEESAENAFKWFKKAVDTGGVIISSDEDINAEILLGICYFEGIGTDQN